MYKRQPKFLKKLDVLVSDFPQVTAESALQQIQGIIDSMNCNVSPSIVITQWRQIDITWKHFVTAMNVYFDIVEVVDKDCKIILKQELQMIPLQVHEMIHFDISLNERDSLSWWPPKSKRIELFCKETFVKNIPQCLQKLILKFYPKLSENYCCNVYRKISDF